MKKRWICLFVENEIGVLAGITGLFSGKSYNLNSLTVGETEDKTISRITIGLTSDDKTFEQVKKQLNRRVEVIKAVDYTEIPIHIKELMYVKITVTSEKELLNLFFMSQVFKFNIIDYNSRAILLEYTDTEDKNNKLIGLLRKYCGNRIEIVRGGNVAIEALDVI